MNKPKMAYWLARIKNQKALIKKEKEKLKTMWRNYFNYALSLPTNENK